MEHLDVQLAHRLLQGQLDPTVQARWQQHIEDCTQCSELLAAERALLTMLSLGDAAMVPASPDIGRMLDQVPGLRPNASGRGRHLVWGTILGLVSIAALTLLLAWQLRSQADDESESARALGIPREEEEHVIVNLTTLAALERDPWLADEYETVRALERLITDQEP